MSIISEVTRCCKPECTFFQQKTEINTAISLTNYIIIYSAVIYPAIQTQLIRYCKLRWTHMLIACFLCPRSRR